MFKPLGFLFLCMFSFSALAAPSELGTSELGLVDALIAFLANRWPEIGAGLYALTFARACVPESVAKRNGVQWLFWFWDRIAANWGGAKNA